MESPLSSVSIEVEEDTILSTATPQPIPVPPPPTILHIPTATADNIVHAALEQETLSPRTAYAALEAHGSDISPEVAVLFAKKIAETAIDRADRSVERIKFLMRVHDRALNAQTIAIKTADATIEAMQQRINELEDEQQDAVREHRELTNKLSSTAPFQSNERECPEGFIENTGRVPNFWIHSDSVKLLARYVRRIPGTGLAQGTLGGPDNPIHEHELQALPSIHGSATPNIIPDWFIQSISANVTPFPHVMEEVAKYDDWGLEAEVERYHRTDTELVELQHTLHEVQAAIDTRVVQKHACHYRLARADIGDRLASLQALSVTFQEGRVEKLVTGRRLFGRGRPRD